MAPRRLLFQHKARNSYLDEKLFFVRNSPPYSPFDLNFAIVLLGDTEKWWCQCGARWTKDLFVLS